MKMLTLFAILFFLTFAGAFSDNVPYFTDSPNTPLAPASTNKTVINSPTSLVIQLAIICDLDFSTLFEHDVDKMLEYWKLVLYDVHLRYKTLPSFNFSFQITSLRVLKKPVLFIENSRDELGRLDVREILFSMEEWLGPKVKQMPSFDIAVLATGATAHGPLENPTGVGRQSSICLGNSIPGKWISSVVVSIRATDVAQLVAHVIGHVLGAPFDNEESFSQNDCGTYPSDKRETFLMNSDGGHLRHFFSKCTNKILANRFEKFPPHCLQPNSNQTHAMVLYDSAKQKPSSVSILNQCKIRTNLSIVSTKERFEADYCDWIECQSLNPSSSSPEYVRPLDGSPCGPNNYGRCFRGFCSPPGVNLVNIATDKCLVFEDEKPKMKTCSFETNLLPTELASLVSNQLGGVFLVYKLLALDEHGVLQKCVMLDDDNATPKLERCHPFFSFDWNLEKVETFTSNVFRILHNETGSCLKTMPHTMHVVGACECDKYDDNTHWKIVLGNGTALLHSNYEDFIQKPVVIYDHFYCTSWSWQDLLIILPLLALIDQLRWQYENFLFFGALGRWRFSVELVVFVLSGMVTYHLFFRSIYLYSS